MPLPKEEYFTYADYLTWEEQEHTELIEGVPMMMAPPSRMHQQISGEIFRQLANYLEGKQCRVYAAPFLSVYLRSPIRRIIRSAPL